MLGLDWLIGSLPSNRRLLFSLAVDTRAVNKPTT
jgi:hypothetical protein